MNNISIVVYDNLNGKSTKLFSVESNKKRTLESDIASMILALETKININPMLISKHIAVSKNRHHVLIEMMDFVAHPEDYKSNMEKTICDNARMKSVEVIGCE